MTRIAKWIVNRREYIAHYVDDPADRAEAIAFFRAHDSSLHSNCPITNDVGELTTDVANSFLAANPVRETFSALFVYDRREEIGDDDLARLSFIPEIRRFNITSHRISDDGIRHLSSLVDLEGLLIYSNQITDASLKIIANLKTLRTIDLQGSLRITRSGFDWLTSQLPNLDGSWGPNP